MAEKEKESSVNKAVVVLVDAVLKDPTWSKIGSVLVGCGIVVVICPAISICLLITLAVARTSAWAVWLGVGAGVGVGGLLVFQWLRRRRAAQRAGGEV